MTNDDQRVKDIMDVGRARSAELQRVIRRVCDGDTAELVRHVVEQVTGAMEEAMIQDGWPDGLFEAVLERMVAAKFEAFEQATGHPYTTTACRAITMIRESRKANQHG